MYCSLEGASPHGPDLARPRGFINLQNRRCAPSYSQHRSSLVSTYVGDTQLSKLTHGGRVTSSKWMWISFWPLKLVTCSLQTFKHIILLSVPMPTYKGIPYKWLFFKGCIFTDGLSFSISRILTLQMTYYGPYLSSDTCEVFLFHEGSPLPANSKFLKYNPSKISIYTVLPSSQLIVKYFIGLFIISALPNE